MERIMAIYDVDPFYASRFADFVNQKERLPFTAVSFSSLAKLKDFAREHPIELLLISRQVWDQAGDIPAGQVVTLCEGEVVEMKEADPAVYKYQSGDRIVREVMACYSHQQEEPALAVVREKALVVGVYSPVNRCLKTSFTLTMGQLLARNQKVLCINLEEYSGFSRLIGETCLQDLSDVIYLYRQGSYNWLKLKSIVHSWGGMDYIPPVRYGEDLSQISPEELAGLIQQIARESGYDTVLVDMGQMGRSARQLLAVCDGIYMPVKDDGISAAKIEEFEDYLSQSGDQDILGRIAKLKLPYHNSFGRRDSYLEQLLWGELGDYVRQLLRGGLNQWRK